MMSKIIQGDCLEVMKTFEDNQFDLVVTSPPYNLGNSHHTGTIRHNPYDDDLPEAEYQQQQIAVLDGLYRVVSDSVFYNHKNRIKHGRTITPYEWLLKTKWTVRQELVWFNRSQNFDKIRFYPMTERIYWLTKGETAFNNAINHHDLFNWQAEGTNKEHTRAFPLKMVKDILICFPENYKVLDPYMGSGTVLRACKDLHRDCTGIEINPKYIEIIKKRERQEVLL